VSSKDETSAGSLPSEGREALLAPACSSGAVWANSGQPRSLKMSGTVITQRKEERSSHTWWWRRRSRGWRQRQLHGDHGGCAAIAGETELVGKSSLEAVAVAATAGAAVHIAIGVDAASSAACRETNRYAAQANPYRLKGVLGHPTTR